MTFYTKDLATELEAYLKDNNPSMQISMEEAIKQKAVPVVREFTFETFDLKQYHDQYSFFGECSLRIEHAYSLLFLEYKVKGFTPYKVTQLPISYGIAFKIETFIVF